MAVGNASKGAVQSGTSKTWMQQLRGDFRREGAKIVCIKNGRRDVVADFSEFGYDGECWARAAVGMVGGM